MVLEHEEAVEPLRHLRAVTGDHHVPPDACANHLSLHERLAALEHGTRMHLHKETHVPFPAAARPATG